MLCSPPKYLFSIEIEISDIVIIDQKQTWNLLELLENDQAMIKKSDSANFTTPFHYGIQSKPV